MIDIQNQPDFRNIPIDKVGIKGLRYPVKVLDKTKGHQYTVAKINMYVDLPHQCKGTHMSRFVEILHLSRPQISLESLSLILEDMKEILGAQSSHIEISFPYFIEKLSPVFDQSAIPNGSAVFQVCFAEFIGFSTGSSSGSAGGPESSDP